MTYSSFREQGFQLKTSRTSAFSGDSEDLMGQARQELGLGNTKSKSRFPQKGTCLGVQYRHKGCSWTAKQRDSDG